MEKYFGQQCQDDTLNQKFKELHQKLVNEIISFCKENELYQIEGFHLGADGVNASIFFGKWAPCTDSCLEFYSSKPNEKGIPYLISM